MPAKLNREGAVTVRRLAHGWAYCCDVATASLLGTEWIRLPLPAPCPFEQVQDHCRRIGLGATAVLLIPAKA
jgi:hypothetical protein